MTAMAAPMTMTAAYNKYTTPLLISPCSGCAAQA
jgi:hypothetical protein